MNAHVGPAQTLKFRAQSLLAYVLEPVQPLAEWFTALDGWLARSPTFFIARPVILDLAALDRKSVEPESTVQLELEGVRLKTGLKLLLDQVGLTYHVVAEDNLMIITDQEGSEDPADRIWAELRALHRDLHAVQDAVDDLGDYLGVQGAEGPHVRKPTIIEEMPEKTGERPRIGPEKPGRTGEKPEGAGSPAQGAHPQPLRVPLAGPRRSL